MAVSVNATTVDLAQGLGTMGVKNTNVVHTPPPITTTAHPDYTIKNTGRTKMATESFGANNQKANHS